MDWEKEYALLETRLKDRGVNVEAVLKKLKAQEVENAVAAAKAELEQKRQKLMAAADFMPVTEALKNVQNNVTERETYLAKLQADYKNLQQRMGEQKQDI